MKNEIKSIGIDVSKNTLDICILEDNSKEKYMKIENNYQGIAGLVRKLKNCKFDKQTLPLVFESTGDYHILLGVILRESGLNACIINPLITKRFNASNIRKIKTDKQDSKTLAQIGLQNKECLDKFIGEREDIILKKKLSVLHTIATKMRAMKASINSLKEVHKSLDTQEDQDIERLEETFNLFRKSVKSLEGEIVKYIVDKKGVQSISRIKGVSEKTASVIGIHIKDKKFENKRQLIAFTGLDVSVCESGMMKRKGKLSKRGNAQLRSTVVQCAWGLKMHNESFNKLYEYHKKQGKHYYTCLIILARKLLSVIFGMLKNGSEYDSELVKKELSYC